MASCKKNSEEEVSTDSEQASRKEERTKARTPLFPNNESLSSGDVASSIVKTTIGEIPKRDAFRALSFEELSLLPPEQRKAYYAKSPRYPRTYYPNGFEEPRMGNPSPAAMTAIRSYLPETPNVFPQIAFRSPGAEIQALKNRLSAIADLPIYVAFPHTMYEDGTYIYAWGGHGEEPQLGYAMRKTDGAMFRWHEPDFEFPNSVILSGEVVDSANFLILQYQITHPEYLEEE